MQIGKFGASIGLALLLSGCQSSGVGPVDTSSPVKAGTMRVATKNPDPARWIAERDPSQIVYKCRPLACADHTAVIARFDNAPTSKPDPAALSKLAGAPADVLARASSRPGDTSVVQATKLAGRVEKTKGYPAVQTMVALKKTDGRTLYFMEHTVFANVAMLKLQVGSFSRSAAEKAMQEFLSVVVIEEGAAN
jgi:hypothetical protein